MSHLSEIFSHNLAAMRGKKGLKQAQLASLCGWENQSRIANYETNAREPTLADIEKLAHALDTDIYTLLRPNGEAHTALRPPLAADKSQKIKTTIGKLLNGLLANHFNSIDTSGKIPIVVNLYELLHDDNLCDWILTLNKQTLFRLLNISE